MITDHDTKNFTLCIINAPDKTPSYHDEVGNKKQVYENAGNTIINYQYVKETDSMIDLHNVHARPIFVHCHNDVTTTSNRI